MEPTMDRRPEGTSLDSANEDGAVDVAIIGAGLAGLAAARRLVHEGLRVSLFDKGRGPGGRTSRRRASPFAFDHGAQYFTVRDEGFERIVRAWQRRGIIVPWTPRLAVLGGGADATRLGSSAPEDSGRAVESAERFVGVPGMNAMAKDLARGLNVHTNVRIVRCEKSSAEWRLVSSEGTAVAGAQRLLITTPPPQALPLLAHAPEIAHVVEAAAMAPCVAVLLGFGEALPIEIDAAFVNAGPLSWIARDSSKPGRPDKEAWVLHATTAWSREHFDDGPEAQAMQLRAAFEEATNTVLPQHAVEQVQRWKYAQPDPASEQVTLFDPARGVGLAGDWLNGGRCEGAFLSGVRAAEEILRHAGAPRGAHSGGG